jgi:hypothetical protein
MSAYVLANIEKGRDGMIDEVKGKGIFTENNFFFRVDFKIPKATPSITKYSRPLKLVLAYPIAF